MADDPVMCSVCREAAAVRRGLCRPCDVLWADQPCPVEGCRFQQTDDDGCGLAKLYDVKEAIRRWDAGDPIERGCLAMRRAESIKRTRSDGSSRWS